jgi:hypothetical protein
MGISPDASPLLPLSNTLQISAARTIHDQGEGQWGHKLATYLPLSAHPWGGDEH